MCGPPRPPGPSGLVCKRREGNAGEVKEGGREQEVEDEEGEEGDADEVGQEGEWRTGNDRRKEE